MSVGGGLGEIFVNHDARMHIAGEHAIPELLEAHKRSKYLTNLMLLISGVSGGLAYQHTKDNYWLIGSGLMLGKLIKGIYIFMYVFLSSWYTILCIS